MGKKRARIFRAGQHQGSGRFSMKRSENYLCVKTTSGKTSLTGIVTVEPLIPVVATR
jgi:hypothetical protein